MQQRSDLKHYHLTERTRLVFARRDPSLWGALLSVALLCIFFAVAGQPITFTCFAALLLGVGALTPQLRVLAVEEAEFVLINKAWVGPAIAVSIPFANVAKVTQGNEFRRAYVHIVLHDGSVHDISFLAGRRGPRPRFGVTVNRTSRPFPPDPAGRPAESATALIEHLLEHGVQVEQQAASRFQRWVNWRS